MDLRSERSGLESVENNEVIITPQGLANVDGNKIASNGSYGGEFNGSDDNPLVDSKAEDGRVVESLSTPRSTSDSPRSAGYSLSVGSSPQATKKGYGLKKWRRIRREFSKDGSSSVDASKILKRGLSTSVVNSSKPQGVSIETRQTSEGSSSSTNAILKSMGVAADGSGTHGSNLDSRVVGPSFGAGTDSDNSEDRSSKSSTAASVPKNRMRALSGKNLVNSVQRSQPAKSRIETSKKHRGERVKTEKENSHSSMESDSRSSNVVFMQGTTSVTSNGRHRRHSGKSMNYDGANSYEAQDGEQHFDEELQTGYNKENVGEFETLSQEDLAADLSWEVREEKVENNGLPTDPDSLVESIHTLQSAQEELEKEIQKLREIGTEPVSLFDGSTEETALPSEFASGDSSINEACASDPLHSGERTQNSSEILETQVVSLKQNMNLLENKLEEANAELKVKEAKVIELECALKSNESPIEKIESLQKNHNEMEAELEGLFKQKIEAEIEYLAISRTIKNLKVDAADHFALFEEQKTLASEQAQVLNELGDVESKAVKLKRQAENLETKYEDVVVTEEVLRLQNRVYHLTSCLFMQLILLVLVFVFLLLQLSPHYEGVVPT
ncbi:WPP domain-interacting protein 2-like [Rhododendron vialii]|uniref:WPP domain-interacting protein 2-like n=1 Tax=Rhododendron vialii TaxID=182163 RepID=UPI00265FE6AA|nr:WPP domain-interacting protein 2-like [Rhododendron vialii]